MSWIKLDDQFLANEKVLGLTPEAVVLYFAGLSYCSMQLTDGLIRTTALPLVLVLGKASPPAVDELVLARLWEKTEGGYRVHDYLEYQPSAAKVKEERAANAARQTAWRERHNGHSNGVTNGTSNSVANAVNNMASNGCPGPAPPGPGGLTTAVVKPESEGATHAAPHTPAKTPRAPKSNGQGAGWNHGPLIDAFKAEGLAAPVLAGRLESDAARKLLGHFAPEQLATVWDAVVEQRWGDQYDRDHLSFAHLAERDRVRRCLGALGRNGVPTTSVVQNDPRSPPRVKGWVEGRYYCLGLGCGWSGTPRPGDQCRLCETIVPEHALVETP